MKTFVLLTILMCRIAVCSAESDLLRSQAEEMTLYDHYLFLQRMQESLAGRSLEEEARLQPEIQRAEQKACQQLRRERQERVPKEDYRRQGGDQFLVFALQFEQYCETAQEEF